MGFSLIRRPRLQRPIWLRRRCLDGIEKDYGGCKVVIRIEKSVRRNQTKRERWNQNTYSKTLGKEYWNDREDSWRFWYIEDGKRSWGFSHKPNYTLNKLKMTCFRKLIVLHWVSLKDKDWALPFGRKRKLAKVSFKRYHWRKGNSEVYWPKC